MKRKKDIEEMEENKKRRKMEEMEEKEETGERGEKKKQVCGRREKGNSVEKEKKDRIRNRCVQQGEETELLKEREKEIRM